MEEKWVRIYIGLIDVMCYLNLQHKRKPLGNNLNEFNESLIMQKRSYILEAINAKLLVKSPSPNSTSVQAKLYAFVC